MHNGLFQIIPPPGWQTRYAMSWKPAQSWRNSRLAMNVHPILERLILFWRRQKSGTPAFRSVNLRRINEKEIRAILDDNFRKAEARAFSLSSPKGGEGRGEEAVF